MKFIVTILSFFVLLFVCDKCIVKVEDKLYATKDNKINYASFNTDNAEIVILGSSRASHHYVPQIFEDSLGMSCVNLGVDGHGILYNYALFHLLTRNNTPKVIIYEYCGFDWEEGGLSTYASNTYLAPAYGRSDVVDTLINAVGKNYKRVLTLLNTYKYNGRVHNVVFNSHQIANNKGYQPLYGKFEGVLTEDNVDENEEVKVNADKVIYLERLIKVCRQKGIKLLFAISPSLTEGSTQGYELLSDLCGNDIPLLNHIAESKNLEMYKDKTHLNNDGARWYTAMVVEELKQILEL